MVPLSRVLLPFVAVAAVTPAIAAATRLPHLKLKQSFPAKDTVLSTSPDAIRLWLTEKADLPATRITLTDAANAAIAVERPSRGAEADAPIVAKLASPLRAGVYRVTWKTMSKDGHVVNGVFAFTVKTP